MKYLMPFFALIFAAAAFAKPPLPAFDNPDCNWGGLTAVAIVEDGFDQGGHSSDPSGDGMGRDDGDQPRLGLGNVVDQGDLEATCALIEGLLP